MQGQFPTQANIKNFIPLLKKTSSPGSEGGEFLSIAKMGAYNLLVKEG